MQNEERPRALLFDWDNTLVDTWAVIHQAYRETFEAMGQEPWSLEEIRQKVRHSARDSFPQLFGARAEEATRLFYEAFERDHLNLLQPLPGVAGMLKDLANSDDLFLAVVSNKSGHLLRLEAEHLGWDQVFSALIGANDAAKDKPAVDAVYAALAPGGLEPGPLVWFIGDTDVDMICAHDAGCRAVLLRSRNLDPGEFDHCPPDLQLQSPGELTSRISAFTSR